MFSVFLSFWYQIFGGSLTPLGDPPLFLGFINGVERFFLGRGNHVRPDDVFEREFVGPVLSARLPRLAG